DLLYPRRCRISPAVRAAISLAESSAPPAAFDSTIIRMSSCKLPMPPLTLPSCDRGTHKLDVPRSCQYVGPEQSRVSQSLGARWRGFRPLSITRRGLLITRVERTSSGAAAVNVGSLARPGLT